MDVVITGSHGLIGSALLPALVAAGHRPIRLVRSSPVGDEIRWDPAQGTIDAGSLEGVGAVIHLAGAGICDKRWTPAYRQLLIDSRRLGTQTLSGALTGLQRKPAVLLSGSAIGIYGNRGDDVLTEDSPTGRGFLADLCTGWEAATQPAQDAGVRVVHLRTGVVLSAKGGALAKQLLPFKLGLGGRVGNGKQWFSWISLEDEVRAIIHLLTASVAGPVNLTAPNPVTNNEFTKALGAALKRPTLLPMPLPAVRALLGRDLVQQLLLDSQRVLPNQLSASGFVFDHTTVKQALTSILT
jgi:uncharacterized protein